MQRYETIGDWLFDGNGDLQIRVSDMGNWKYECLVALHEAIEALLCKDRGIEEEAVSKFDIDFEVMRKIEPKLIGDMEPGDMPTAPYYSEHQFATSIEKMIAKELKVDWEHYNKTVNEL